MRWRRRKREEDLDRELRAHLDLETEDQRDSGLPFVEARYAAQRAFGNATLIGEDTRAVWGWTSLERLGQDLRYALRIMRKSPAFTATAVLSLALGIGANTAIFTLIDRLLLNMLPVRNPHELTQLMRVEAGRADNSFSYPVVHALDSRRDVFSGVCGFTWATFNVGSTDTVARVGGAWVTGAYYETLGVTPVLGRLLARDDDRRGAAPAAVISYGYWERRYGRDPQVVGTIIRIEGQPVPIVGVSPAGFSGANVGFVADITLPVAALTRIMPERAALLETEPQWLRALARPRPGLSRTQLKARLDVLWPQMASAAVTVNMEPDRRRVPLSSSIDVSPGGTGWSPLRGQFRQPLLLLMSVAGLVLLIACANVANLLLARATARRREIALRFAIGSGRGRIIRQLLTESVLLSSIAAAFGVAIAWLAGRFLVNLLSSGRREAMVDFDLAPDWHILAFTSAVALGTGILFGLVPALRATVAAPGPALKDDTRTSAGSRTKLAPALVVLQLALSLVLLVGTGLLVRTLRNLQQLDAGFRHEGVLLMNVDARRAGFEGPRLAVLYRELLDRLQHLPGVQSASLSTNTPLSGAKHGGRVSVDKQPQPGTAQFNAVTPGYFRTLRTPLLLGRDFTLQDGPGAPPVAIVNEQLVRQYLPHGNPLGRHVAVDSEMEIVGIVKDAIADDLREPPPPAVYRPYFQRPHEIGNATFEVYAMGALAQVAGALKDELRAVLPQAPVQYQVKTLTEQVERSLAQERMLATLATGFGLLALLLAAVGLYGLLAYTVGRRTGEIGIRMALGARQRDVQWLVLAGALRLAAMGIAVGLPAAWAASRLVSSMLFGLTPTDALTTLAATTVLAMTALLAGYLPARRASRVEPMAALKYE
ncbi:MAG: ABC transporter permease [Bryobacterales bacterium]|nr:ABC transporter permease [Bryobacterales bacterium]